MRPLTQDMLLHEVCHPWDAWGCPISWSALELPKALISAVVSPFKDCYILDQAGLKIFVWKGKYANKEEKQQAMSRALVGAELGAGYGAAWLLLGVPGTLCHTLWLQISSGLHQSQELPREHQCGDRERRLRVKCLQAALPEMDCP